MTLPRGGYQSNVKDWVRRALVREVTKRPRVIIKIILPPICFTVGIMSSERCSVGFPLNIAHCAKAKPFWCHQTREPLPTCLLSLQYAFWQIQNGISHDSPLFHKSLLCGVSRLWLSCEQLHQTELWDISISYRVTLGLLSVPLMTSWVGRPYLGRDASFSVHFFFFC